MFHFFEAILILPAEANLIQTDSECTKSYHLPMTKSLQPEASPMHLMIISQKHVVFLSVSHALSARLLPELRPLVQLVFRLRFLF